jgi:hypothetical protein
MADFEGGEFAGCGTDVAALVAGVVRFRNQELDENICAVVDAIGQAIDGLEVRAKNSPLPNPPRRGEGAGLWLVWCFLQRLPGGFCSLAGAFLLLWEHLMRVRRFRARQAGGLFFGQCEQAGGIGQFGEIGFGRIEAEG